MTTYVEIEGEGVTDGLADDPVILLAESHLPTAMALSAALSPAGCKVELATSGDAAVEKCLERTPYLVIIDVDVIGGGFALFGRLQEPMAFAGTPIIFIARDFDDANWRRGLEMGASDYIERPFGGPAFVRRVLSHVKKG